MSTPFFITLIVSFLGLIPSSHCQYIVPQIANFSGPNGPLVDLGYIKVQGTKLLTGPFDVNAWLGIRYAEAPAGKMRFREAVDIESATSGNSTFDASTYGPYCYQGFTAQSDEATSEAITPTGNRPESEDCLLLDIYAPAHPISAGPLPVVVYIHGGGYIQGLSSGIPLSGLLSTVPEGVVVVSIQYRLAAFGFLGGQEVSNLGTANAGLVDQRQALQWIQRHIGAFGGDSTRVTINGPSAGAGSVAYHYIWNGGEDNPPFQGGYAEFPRWTSQLNRSQLEHQYQSVLRLANCTDFFCLQGLSSDEFEEVQQAAMSSFQDFPYGTFYFGPSVHGVHIRDWPSQETQAGHFSKVPLMVSREGNEGSLFTPANITTTALFEDRIMSLFPAAGPNFLTRLTALYPPELPGPFGYNVSVGSQQRANFVLRDVTVQCPSYYLASALSDAGVKVWKYVYTLPSFLTASHGSASMLEIGFLTNDTAVAAQSRMFLDYMGNFFANGDVNERAAGLNSSTTTGKPWPQYGSDSLIYLVNQKGTSLPVIADIDATQGRCDFLRSHSAVVQG